MYKVCPGEFNALRAKKIRDSWFSDVHMCTYEEKFAPTRPKNFDWTINTPRSIVCRSISSSFTDLPVKITRNLAGKHLHVYIASLFRFLFQNKILVFIVHL